MTSPARCGVFVAVAVFLLTRLTPAAQMLPVHYAEGLVHGFLVLRSTDGRSLADGDLIQRAEGDRVTTRLVFHFKDGSLQDETTVFSQRRGFQLITDRLVQKGPSFPQPLDMSIDRASGRVVVRYADAHGSPKEDDEHFDLTDAISNGLIITLLKNVRPADLPLKRSLVVATPRPRLVTLTITLAGQEPFSTGGTKRQAAHYVVKVEIGGVTGWLAEVFGKVPPDSHVWILGADAPAFVKSESVFYYGGPLWRIELTSPRWGGE